jgi:hypothetical protein
MRDWKVAGASISPKGMTTYSKCPRFVVNVVLWMSSSLIRIWWYPNLRSILVKTFAPNSSSNKSSMMGWGICFWLCRNWVAYSPHTSSMFHIFPLMSLVMILGLIIWEDNMCFIRSSMSFFWWKVNLYCLKLTGFAPSKRVLVWSTDLCGANSWGLLTVYFGTPNIFITLWFGLDYGTNLPLGTLII